MATGALWRNNGAHRRGRTAVVTIALLVLSLIAGPAWALGGFENDGDMPVNQGGRDWAGFSHDHQTDDTGDSSYKGGVKEDDLEPGILAGNVSKKSDLTAFRAGMFFEGVDPFLVLAWHRVAGGGGSVALNFELNQKLQQDPSTNGKWPLDRTEGDLLVTFDFNGTALKFTTAEWQPQGHVGSCGIASNKKPPCWSVATELTSTMAVGSVDQTSNPEFGEMVVNLEEAGLFDSSQCTNFASVTAKTRASHGFDSQLEDLIPPKRASLGNCSIDIVKEDDAGTRLAGATFQLYSDNAGARGTALSGNTCSTTATSNGTCSIGVPGNGTYWVSETAVPSGHTGDADKTVSVTPATSPASLTFVNQRVPRSVTVRKSVSTIGTSNDQFSFELACQGVTLGPANNASVSDYTGGVAHFSLGHDDEEVFTGIPVGSDCTGTETNIASVWTTTVDTGTGGTAGTSATVKVSDTAPRSILFTNTRQRGQLTVSKDVVPDGPQSFDFEVDCDTTLASANLNDSDVDYTTGNAVFSLEDQDAKTFTILSGSNCTVVETGQQDWTTEVAVGTSTAPGTPAAGTSSGSISIVAGRHHTAAFTNTRDTGTISVSKTVSPASASKPFQFSLSCTNYPLSQTNNPNVAYDTNGVASFQLAHGQTAAFSAIPTGTSCTASETADAAFTTTVSVNSATPTPGTSGNVTVATGTQTAEFTNTEVTQGCVSNCEQQTYGSLTVAKETTGGDGTFDFSVDCAGTAHDADLRVTTTNGRGTSSTISQIPTGTDCTVTETVPAGWRTAQAVQSREVNGAETVTFSNTKLEDPAIEVDLAIDKTDLEDPVLVGDDITYRLDVSNIGEHAATGVTVVDTLPAGVDYVSADSATCTVEDQVITCGLGELAAGTSRTITVTVKATEAGTVTNRATVTANEAELDRTNNAASEDTAVNQVAGEVVETPPPVTPTPPAAEAPAPSAPETERLEVEGVQVEATELPRTGAAIGVAATLGSALLLLGLATVAATRRRTTSE